MEIDPAEVFEMISFPFPQEWKECVKFREPHNDIECKMQEAIAS